MAKKETTDNEDNVPTTSYEEKKSNEQPPRQNVRTHSRKKIIYGWLLAAAISASVILIYVALSGFDSESAKGSRGKAKPQLVVIMIPGLRWDSLELMKKQDLGGFQLIKREGIRVEYVDTVFPSHKYPSWTTLQTGLYPEVHGILGNVMFDRRTNLKFDGTKPTNVKDSLWWDNVEPIWITATRKRCRVATLEWNNADVPFWGILPEIPKGYTSSKQPFLDRIKEVMDRLEQGFDLIMMAYDGVDNSAARYGINSIQMREELRLVARGLDVLLTHALAEGLQRSLRLVVASDRGYEAGCAARRALREEEVGLRVDAGDVLATARDGDLLLVYTAPGRELRVAQQLTVARDYVSVLRRDIPGEFHYKRGKWAPDILVYPAYLNSSKCRRHVIPRVSALRRFYKTRREEEAGPEAEAGVAAAATPTAPALLLAWGSPFKGGGLVHPPIHLVDVYQILTNLLQVTPRPHNGSWAAVRGFMGQRPAVPSRDTRTKEEGPAEFGNIDDKESSNAFDEKEYIQQRHHFTRAWDQAFGALHASQPNTVTTKRSQ